MENADLLEPALLVLNVRSHEVLIRLREINDPFDDAENVCESAGDDAENELDNTLGCVAENEFVHSEPAHQDCADARRDLLVGAQRLPISHRTGRDGLHRLIARLRARAGVDLCEWRLARRTVLR